MKDRETRTTRFPEIIKLDKLVAAMAPSSLNSTVTYAQRKKEGNKYLPGYLESIKKPSR